MHPTTAELIRDRGLEDLVSHSNVVLAGPDAPQRAIRTAVHEALDSEEDNWPHGPDLVASDFIVKALQHTPGAVLMRLEVYEGGVAAGVIDRGDGLDAVPLRPSNSCTTLATVAGNGRGLFLVNNLAQRMTLAPVHEGKVVTAVLARPAGER
ncbi:ATP-binding protein [Streptomyces decoyicus]|uniref:ATP-binding protein n=1 Tax=Streptomyces decoyicus TaxID=249567 RepID=UPI00364BDCC8